MVDYTPIPTDAKPSNEKQTSDSKADTSENLDDDLLSFRRGWHEEDSDWLEDTVVLETVDDVDVEELREDEDVFLLSVLGRDLALSLHGICLKSNL